MEGERDAPQSPERLAVCEFCGANMVYIDKGEGPKGGKPKLRCGRAHASAGCAHRTLYDYKPLEIGVIFGLGGRREQLLQAAKDEVGEVDLAYAAAVSRRDAVRTELENLCRSFKRGPRARSWRVASQLWSSTSRRPRRR